MQFMLEIVQILLYNLNMTGGDMMTMMKRGEGSVDERELAYVGAIDDCSHSFMVSHRLWQSFQSYGLHFHRFYEILIHRRNGGRMAVGRDVFDMPENSFFVIAPHQLHDIVADQPLENYERICIYVTESMLAYAGMSLVPMLEIINTACVNHRNGFQLTPKEYDEIYTMTMSMHRQLAGDPISSYEELEDRLNLFRILTILCRNVERGQQLQDKNERISPLILQITNHISEHYMEPITLDTIAQTFNVSKYHLSHEFARSMRTSVYQYLLVCRVNAAKQMILSGEPITTVAYRCGFNDYSGFLRAFDKVMGESPSAFRKRIQGIVIGTPEPERAAEEGKRGG